MVAQDLVVSKQPEAFHTHDIPSVLLNHRVAIAMNPTDDNRASRHSIGLEGRCGDGAMRNRLGAMFDYPLYVGPIR